MKIILLSDVYKHGVAGEIVEVADGFARNYLIPKGLATKATHQELRRVSKLREAAAQRRMDYEAMLNDLGHKIDGTELIFFRRAANTGKLFGSVTTDDIALALDEATGVDINRRRISQQPLRDTGMHEVPVRLGTDVSPILNIRIIADDQRVIYERQREAIEEGLIDAIEYDDKGYIVPVDLDRLRNKREKAEAEAEAQAEVVEAVAATEAEPAAVDGADDAPPASDSADTDA